MMRRGGVELVRMAARGLRMRVETRGWNLTKELDIGWSHEPTCLLLKCWRIKDS